MIAWLLWPFVALHLFLLDGFLKQVLVSPGGVTLGPDLTVCIGLYLALFARHRSLAGLLCLAALARSVFLPGSLFWHMLALGLPVALLLPLRVVLSTSPRTRLSSLSHWGARRSAISLRVNCGCA